MPAMMWTSPLATPISSAAAAPNSSATSSAFIPAVSSWRWKNPPPPKMATASRNGCGRSEMLKSKTGLPSRNGNVNAAPSFTSFKVKTPTVSGGKAKANPARMPNGSVIRSSEGPSPKRPGGMALRISSMNTRSPPKRSGVSGSKSTETFTFSLPALRKLKLLN